MQTEEEIRRLLRSQEIRIRRIFEAAIAEYQDDLNLAQIQRFIERGQIVSALGEIESIAAVTASASQRAFLAAAEGAVLAIQAQGTARIAFNVANEGAVSVLQRNQFQFVQNFTQQQIAATRTALTEGVRQGLGPRALARSFRDSIGLTEKGEATVQNYRKLLQRIGADDVPSRLQREALTRSLRDGRGDRTIRAALRNDRALTKAQIDNMVERYRKGALKNRALTIARTEALSSTHQGQDNAIAQAIGNGNIQEGTAVSEWLTSIDGREREWHNELNGVMVPYGTRFQNSKGLILHPGDRDASAENVINCRCVRVIRIRSLAFVDRLAA